MRYEYLFSVFLCLSYSHLCHGCTKGRVILKSSIGERDDQGLLCLHAGGSYYCHLPWLEFSCHKVSSTCIHVMALTDFPSFRRLSKCESLHRLHSCTGWKLAFLCPWLSGLRDYLENILGRDSVKTEESVGKLSWASKGKLTQRYFMAYVSEHLDVRVI
jgi:hypothetical protein